MPTISVIVPVYKVEPYLHRCVDSILNQTFRDFELILVDDGSPDNCGAICDAYALQDKRVVVIHQKNQGLSAARNAGLDWMFANSDSQWISFVDSDDWIHPDMLDHLLSINLEYGTEISACEHCRTSDVAIKVDNTEKTPLLYTPDVFLGKYGWTAGYVWAKLYRRTCFEHLRFPVGKCYEDVFLMHHVLFSQKQIAMLWVTYYFYYINPNSITQRKWSEQRLDYFAALKDRIAFFGEHRYTKLMKDSISSYVSLCFRQLGQISLIEDHNMRQTARKTVQQELVWGLKQCIKERTFPTIPIGGYIAWIRKRIDNAKIRS